MNVQPLHDVHTVRGNGLGTEVELVGDFLGDEAKGHLAQHLALTAGQR